MLEDIEIMGRSSPHSEVALAGNHRRGKTDTGEATSRSR